MIRLVRRFGQLVGSATLLGVVAVGCVSTISSDDNAGQGSAFPDAGLVRVVVEGGKAGEAGEAAQPYELNPLCGWISNCDRSTPDDPMACRDFEGGGISYPPLPDGGPMGAGGAFGFDAGDAAIVPDASLDAGGRDAADAMALDGAADGGDAADGGLLDGALPDGAVGVDGAVPSSSGDATMTVFEPTGFPPRPGAEAGTPPEPVYACRVRRSEVDPSIAEHRCDLAGTGDVGAACTSSRDCRPGLGCVGEANAGQCLPFCCERPKDDKDMSLCDEGSFCTERPLRDDAGDDPLLVPVCAIADQCKLDDPYPCPEDQDVECACPASKACSVVRNDGTTSCVAPGEATTGEACEPGAHDCAPGFFCARSMKTCVKICKTNREGECGKGKCQAAANLPKGYGLCAGMVP